MLGSPGAGQAGLALSGGPELDGELDRAFPAEPGPAHMDGWAGDTRTGHPEPELGDARAARLRAAVAALQDTGATDRGRDQDPSEAREAFDARETSEGRDEIARDGRRREIPADLADRMREAAKNIDPETYAALSARAETLRQDRETKARTEAAERARAKKLERQRDIDKTRSINRDNGTDYGL